MILSSVKFLTDFSLIFSKNLDLLYSIRIRQSWLTFFSTHFLVFDINETLTFDILCGTNTME